jgi:hypothetical protein
MSLWGNVDNANNRPKYANTANVLGISVAEAEANTGVAHPGWVQVTLGTGPVASITIDGAGTGYANGDAVVAANTNGSGFVGEVVTDGTGAITDVTIVEAGQYSVAPVLTITTAAGTTGALSAVVEGGRFGRAQQETLVAMSSIA